MIQGFTIKIRKKKVNNYIFKSQIVTFVCIIYMSNIIHSLIYEPRVVNGKRIFASVQINCLLYDQGIIIF